MTGILGKKVGMTQVFDDNGKHVAVTIIESMPSEVLAVRTMEKNGYSAVQLGAYDRKNKSKNKPSKLFIKEIRLKAAAPQKVGDVVKVDAFTEGDFVDVTGFSKGKGFQGGVKRWNWRGGGGGHGSMFHRRVGSVGQNTYPGRVMKGKTMPGHLGDEKVTVQNLKIIKIDKESNLIAVKGAVPGHINSFVVVRDALKKTKKAVKKDGAKK